MAITDTFGNSIEWHWGLAGQGMHVRIRDGNNIVNGVYLRDDQLEVLVRAWCVKLAGEYVPHAIWSPTEPMTDEQRATLIAYIEEIIGIHPQRGAVYDRQMESAELPERWD